MTLAILLALAAFVPACGTARSPNLSAVTSVAPTTSATTAIAGSTTTVSTTVIAPPATDTPPSYQDGNENPVARLQTRLSDELDDNRIGIHITGLWDLAPEAFATHPDPTQRSVDDLDVGHILSQGVTRARVSINELDWGAVSWGQPEVPIDPRHVQFITDLAAHGIIVTFVLTFWDKEWVAAGGELPSPRFKTEAEIQRYLDYVRYVVGELKGRVEYFEIWNEPNSPGSIQSIDVADYIYLVSRAVPVIREEYPEARIVVGGVGDIRAETEFEYFSGIIESDEIMPLVDVVSWHGMYDVSPEYDYFRDYYYGYPSLVAQIRATAASHGFTGEFVSDELSWRTWDSPCHCRHEGVEALSSELVAAKNYARGIIMNLGLDLSVSHFYVVPWRQPELILQAIRNVSTIMAGARAQTFDVDVASPSNIVTYTFTLPDGDRVLALWNDDAAQDVDPGANATVTLPGVLAEKVTGMDAVYGFEQELVTHNADGDLVISDLLVKDSPLVLLFSGVVSSPAAP